MNDLKKYLGKIVTIKIDRPLGSKHPKYELKYPLNYGFVPGTKMADGEELDAYILGVSEPIKEFAGKCIAIIHRIDDDDDKFVLVPEGLDLTDEQIRAATDFQEKYFKSDIVR
jgi:inorganic pyrophosphatase